MKKLIIVLCCVLLAASAAAGVLVWNGQLSFVHPLKTPKDGQIRVACVGDSVTYGFGIPNRGKNSYPAQLGRLLGDGYCVNNYGYSGRTVSDSGDRPYRAENLYQKLLSFQPQIIPTPVFPVNGKVKFHIDGDVIDKELVPMTLGIATGRGLPIVDMHTVFDGRSELFSDGCHPNKDGAKLFAETVYAAIQSTVVNH